MMDKRTSWLTIFALMILLTGCRREELGMSSAGEIVFGASTSWPNALGTRTEYSGQRFTVEGNDYERINWVGGTDQITIYSPQAGRLSSSTNHFADYVVGSPTEASERSTAKIDPADGNGLQWGNGAHYFYAFYPAPGSAWKYDGSETGADTGATFVGSGTNQATIHGVVPATQTVKWNASEMEYEANMNYAYMYAGAYVSNPGTAVTLRFHPLVTTLEFNLKAGDAGTDGYALSGFKLKSSSATNTLAGTFDAVLTQSASESAEPGCSISTSGTSNEISLDIQNGSATPTLSTGSTVKVTVFTLPTTQTNLSVEMTFTKSGSPTITRTLELKDRANASSAFSYISVDPCCKAYINNLGVPGGIYYFDLTVDDELEFGRDGGTDATLHLNSYKHNADGSNDAVGISSILYSSDGVTWRDEPDWVSGVNVGNGTDKVITITASPNTTPTSETTVTATSVGSRTPVTGEYDLSRHTITGEERPAGEYVTANCYVVSAPGTYMFPLVYGNSIDTRKNTSTDYSTAGGGNYAAYNDFKRFDDGNITKPSILHDLGNIPTSDVDVVSIWQSHENASSANYWDADMSIVDGDLGCKYIRFKTNHDHSGWSPKQGNMLIALRLNKSKTIGSTTWPKNTILWSWHIWTTDRTLEAVPLAGSSKKILPVPLGRLDPKLTTQHFSPRTRYVKLTQYASGKSVVIEVRQQGGKRDIIDKTAGYGSSCGYSWGRKDPFIPAYVEDGLTDMPRYGDTPPYNGSHIKSFYYRDATGESSYYMLVSTDPTGYTGVAGKVGVLSSSISSLGASIRSPHLGSSNQTHWGSYAYGYKLWNAAATGEVHDLTQTGPAVTKTVYDPCPPGFSVPATGTFNYFINASGSTDEESVNAIPQHGHTAVTVDDYHTDRGWYFRRYDGDTEGVFFPKTTGWNHGGGGLLEPIYYYPVYIWYASFNGTDKHYPTVCGNVFIYGDPGASPKFGGVSQNASGATHALTVYPAED